MFEGTSTYAQSVDSVMLLIMGISIFFLIGITALMFYFVFRYSRKRNPVALNVEGNTLLEITWLIIPLFIVVGMFWYGFRDYNILLDSGAGAMQVKVGARMWKWDFTYANGKKCDTLYLPIGQNVRLELKSVDVNHGFFLPAFRIKQDVLASKAAYIIIKPEKMGTFVIECTHYCGLNHSQMIAELIVVPKKDFEDWMSGKAMPPQNAIEASSDEEKFGEMLAHNKDVDLLKKYNCLSCHTLNGRKSIGPSFAVLGLRKTTIMADGNEKEISISEDYIRNSILNPDKDIVKGYTKFMMPTGKGRIGDEDLNKIINMLQGKN